jgi:MFS family permease
MAPCGQGSDAAHSYGTNGIVPLWLASLNAYPTSRLSYYALGLTSVAIFVTVVAGVFTDVYGRRWATVFPISGARTVVTVVALLNLAHSLHDRLGLYHPRL